VDKISLHGLIVPSRLGIHPWEQQIEQSLEISLTYACDAKKIANCDDITQAIDYSALSQAIAKFTQTNHFQLLETLAEKLADNLLQQFHMPWLQLNIKKLAAIPGAKSVAIDIERKREQ